MRTGSFCLLSARAEPDAVRYAEKEVALIIHALQRRRNRRSVSIMVRPHEPVRAAIAFQKVKKE